MMNGACPFTTIVSFFEFLILEGAQAGLSWETILKKRDAYREAYDNFDPAIVANYTAKRVDKLLANPASSATS